MDYKAYGIIFRNNSKPYYFKSNLALDIDDEVIVDTEKGLQYGKIVSIKNENINTNDYKEIIRKATKEDSEQYYKNLRDSDQALKKCKDLVKTLNLEMYVINANFNFDRSQLLINFFSDDRIDFRELAKRLAFVYKTRIELRQIGARDKAKQIGGIGVCGRPLCCNLFLNQIDSISMNKAKNQGLALNPSKINGSCGRLFCCLCYEDEEYTKCQKGLLNIGSKIKYKSEEGTIIGVDILSRTYKALVNDEKILIKAEELNNDSKK